jgi:hypothetical protein
MPTISIVRHGRHTAVKRSIFLIVLLHFSSWAQKFSRFSGKFPMRLENEIGNNRGFILFADWDTGVRIVNP